MLARLQHHVTGAIERGESVPIVEIKTPARHTPGPWEIGSINKRDKNLWWAAVFTPKSTGKFHTPRACEALGVDREECEANARLIAAAPDMLEALQFICNGIGGGGDAPEAVLMKWKRRGADAIAKAEGRAQ